MKPNGKAESKALTSKDLRILTQLVDAYKTSMPRVQMFHNQLALALRGSRELADVAHSIRSRIKDPYHLWDKLARKMSTGDQPFAVRPDNLLTSVTDLVGFRVLHLHTTQIIRINDVLKQIFGEESYALLEGPCARTWDDESRAFFEQHNIKTKGSPSLYTSVHYVISSASRTPVTAEIQVRTLMEEVWGEVDHAVNYPAPTSSLGCREQIKALARITSGASRLVDSIFATFDDFGKTGAARQRSAPPRQEASAQRTRSTPAHPPRRRGRSR